MTHKQTFYPLSTAMNRKLRSSKLTSAELRIWLYLVEIDPWGDRYQELDPLTIMTECEVSKATLYRAIAKFQELSLFDFQTRGMTIKNECGINQIKKVSKELATARVAEKVVATTVCELEPIAPLASGIEVENSVSDLSVPSQICTGILKNETEISETIAPSQIRENRPPEPAPVKASSFPQTIQTYSNFKKTLSEEEREGFLNFVRKEIECFPTPIKDVEAWLAGMNKAGEYRFRIYHDRFRTKLGVKENKEGGNIVDKKVGGSINLPQAIELRRLVMIHGAVEGKKLWENWRREQVRKSLNLSDKHKNLGDRANEFKESVISYGNDVLRTLCSLWGETEGNQYWAILTGEPTPC